MIKRRGAVGIAEGLLAASGTVWAELILRADTVACARRRRGPSRAAGAARARTLAGATQTATCRVKECGGSPLSTGCVCGRRSERLCCHV